MATSYKIQRKTNSGVEDIEIDASTLDGKDSSHYLNYNNLTNKPTIPSTSGFLPKTTYEWNKEIAFGSTGKLCIGKFPMYDSNLTVEIKATTSKTYSAILVIATQNVKNTQLGTLTATVYGDPNNDVGKNIYIEHVSGSNMIGVYFSPEAWSKNLIHIQAVALNTNANYGNTAAVDICTNISSIPTTATKQPTNALTSIIPTKTSQLTNDSGFKTTDTTYSISSDDATITLTPSSGAAQTVTINNVSSASYASSAGSATASTTATNATNDQLGNNIKDTYATKAEVEKLPTQDTTYTFANGTNSFTVTPKGGTAQTVTVTPSIANATTSKAGLMSSTDKTNLNTLSNLLGTDSDTVVNKINEVIEIFDSYPEGDKIVDALAGKQSKVAALGSTTKPVYVSADGIFAAASTYAGGTKVTLNGTDKGASTATIYAPTAVGTSGQILKSNGSGAPTWVAQSTLSAGSATKATQDASGNVITSTYATKNETATARNIAAALNSAHVVNADGTLKAKYDGDGNEITATYAKKEYAVYYVAGNTTGTAGTWTGTNSDIKSLYDGLVINYKIGINGADPTTLNINGLGAKTVYLRGTTKVTTQYAVGTMVLLAYNATTGAFYSADYDANSYAYVRQYKTTTNANYPMLFAYETTLPSSYDTKYTRKNSNITANPNTGTINATSFVENGTALSSKYLLTSGGTITGSLTISQDIDANNIYAANDLGAVTAEIEQLTVTDSITLNGSDVVTRSTQSVIDLGVITEDPTSTTNSVLNAVTTPGLYTFRYKSSATATITETCFMTVSTISGPTTGQYITYLSKYLIPDNYITRQLRGTTWTVTTGDFLTSVDSVFSTSGTINANAFNSATNITAANEISAGNFKSSKYYAPTSSGGSTYGVGANGQVLMSNGTTNYWGTISTSGGGGTVSGDYLPLTGGTIDGNLTLTDNSDDSGTLTTPYIKLGYTDDYYGGWYYDEGIYVGAGDEVHLGASELNFNADNSYISLNGSNSNIFIPSVCGLINNADGNAFGFDEGGYPTILNHDGRTLRIATDTLDGDYLQYTFPEYDGYVPVTASQGTSGQVLTSNGNGTYKWSTLTSGGTSGGSTSLEFTLLDDVALDFAGEGEQSLEIDFESFGCSEYMFWVENPDETTTQCFDDYSANSLTLGTNNVITLKKAGDYWIGQNTGDYNFDATQSVRASTVILDSGSNLRFGNQSASGYILVKIFGRG